MRRGLLLVIWLCVIGTVVQLPLLCYEIWLLVTGMAFSELTVWVLLTEHLSFLAWVADLILAVFGSEFGDWILGLPVTLVTTVKLISGAIIGKLALDKVREMDASHGSGGA